MAETDFAFRGLNRFDEVDATGETAMFLAFPDRIDGLPRTAQRRRLSYQLLDLGPGKVVADVGCGPGTAEREMAALVGDEGRIHGFDLSPTFIATAAARAAEAGIANVLFQAADATAPPCAPDSLHAYRAERLFQHLAQPEAALAEAYRCLRSGGRILVMDQDWGSLPIDGDLDTTRPICRAFADRMVNGMLARRLRALMLDAGFVDVTVTPDSSVVTIWEEIGYIMGSIASSAESVLGADAVRAWLDDQKRRATADRFFFSMTYLITTARRP